LKKLLYDTIVCRTTKNNKKEKQVSIFNQHFKHKKSSLALCHCLLSIEPKKNPIIAIRFINQLHNQPILCCILQHSLLFAKPKETLKITKQIPLYSQAKNHCSLVMTLLFFAKKNQNKNHDVKSMLTTQV
jgi:hypothetical protein